MNRWTFIRQLALTTLADYKRKTGREPFTARSGSHAVLDDLAERCFGLLVESDATLPAHIQGELNREEGTITYQPGLLPQSVALVIAHEIGHTALDHPPRWIQDSVQDIDEQPLGDGLLAQNGVQPAYNTRDRWELEANVFAVELLAPAAEVRRRMAANPGWTVKELASYFGLSETAMRNQLAAVLLCNPVDSPTPEPATNAPATSESAPKSPPPMDEHQSRASQAPAPALIIAGPGAGKTRVLIERFLFLARNGVEPRRILALTFSNKAAAEMRERLCVALPGREYEINVFTFHSLGLQFLMAYGESLGYPSVKVLSRADGFVFLRDRLEKLPMGSYESLTAPTRFLEPLLDAFSRAKDELCDPEQFRALAEDWVADLHDQAETDPQTVIQLQLDRERAALCVEAAHIYAAYQSLLRENGFLDYGDLIAQSVRLFDNPEIARKIRGDYDHILVDEFQDINYASGRLIKALDGGEAKVWAVGDPRQNIYTFRGASRANIADFQSDYPGARVLTLNVNYRSIEDIVQAGQAVEFPIAGAESSLFPPELEAYRGRPSSEPAIGLGLAPDAKSEIATVAALVGDCLQARPPDHIAVLCRTNATARRVSEALEAQGVPTNWSGQLEDRSTFKDLMGVLLLAADSPHGLLRLSRLDEHHFSDGDLRLLLQAARRQRSALSALYSAAQGEIEGLSDEGRQQAARMKALAGKLQALPDAWRVLSCYLFEAAQWPRALFADDSLPSRRARTTAGQLANLAREFKLRNVLSDQTDTKAFLDYVRSCRQSGSLEGGDAAHILPGAVTVTTIHKSKGLEWPVVLVPNLVKRPHYEQDAVPLPPGLVRGAIDDGGAYDDACIFYVAVTRARDRLFLTRFEKEGNNRSVAASPHLQELSAILEPHGYLKPFAIERTNGESATVAPGTGDWLLPEPIPYRMLDCYENCSQQFKYRYVYELGDEEQGYAVFHSVLYGTLGWVNEQVSDGVMPSDADILADLDTRWDDVPPQKPGARFDDLYRQGAASHALAFARRIGRTQPPLLRQKRTVELAGHQIELIVDEIEPGPTPILRQHKLGRASNRHTEQTLLALLPLVEVGEETPEIRLSYLEHEEVSRKTNRFHTPRRQKIVNMIAHIQQGQFEPSPNARKCADCPYNLICPA